MLVENLTLTSVVFEYGWLKTIKTRDTHLTLTSVVFELKKDKDNEPIIFI